MSAFRIFATDKPTLGRGPIHPMTREDRAFWQHRDRAAREARERREGRHG